MVVTCCREQSRARVTHAAPRLRVYLGVLVGVGWYFGSGDHQILVRAARGSSCIPGSPVWLERGACPAGKVGYFSFLFFREAQGAPG